MGFANINQEVTVRPALNCRLKANKISALPHAN